MGLRCCVVSVAFGLFSPCNLLWIICSCCLVRVVPPILDFDITHVRSFCRAFISLLKLPDCAPISHHITRDFFFWMRCSGRVVFVLLSFECDVLLSVTLSCG